MYFANFKVVQPKHCLKGRSTEDKNSKKQKQTRTGLYRSENISGYLYFSHLAKF